LVSSCADVQKEQAVAEQLIRSVAAEFILPINVSYSNPLRGSTAEDGGVGFEDSGDESTPVLCSCFWEYPESERDVFPEKIPNTGQFDLVICILWSRLGTAPLQCVMPDGSRPRSATDYEIAWALDQSKRTPGVPELHVYRNRATPVVPLEPKEKRENLCRQWDLVQEFCAAWKENAGPSFRECCHDYQDLEKFENLFREHFRDFLAQQLDQGIGSSKAKARHLESNPFRGLNFFDFEHAALYHGRTRAVGEVLDVLKNQAAADKHFVLVLGPSGSGKSSLVRAGVLPLLIRGRTPAGNGPWRRTLTRPGGAEDPLDPLAVALLAKSALPELQDTASPDEWRNLASQLREDPDGAVTRIAEVLDQLTRKELDRLLDQRKTEELRARRSEGVEVVSPTSLGSVKPKMQLALVVDQLEELFTGVSPALQQKYIATLCALANCEQVFIIATLCSDFYPRYQRFPELVKLIAFGGRYELRPPTPRGFRNMIRFPAEAADLRFERNPETGRSLDEALLKAAIARPEPLPLLEHVLSRLYQRQLDRKDGLLRWSDYRELGRLQDALAQHAESVFLTLKRDEQQALKFVVRHLVAGPGEEGLLNHRTVPYRDLVSSPKLDQRQRAGAKGLVDRLIKEGLLSTDTDPRQKLLISIPQEVLLRRWPRLWQSLSEDRLFFQMRDRLDARLKLWLGRGRQSDDLLHRGIGLFEAETLLRDFGSLLGKSQIDYIQKSLARQKRRYRVRENIGLAAIIGLAIFATFAAIERFRTESRRNGEQGVQQAQQNTGLDTKLKKTEEKLQLAQQNADLANSQRSDATLYLRIRKSSQGEFRIVHVQQLDR
jgi:energy-coupling factor transporter ATP-binding protein EcfA2